MVRVIGATYKKNRIGIIRAVPWSFIVSRVVTGVTQIVFPFFIYHYFLAGNLSSAFGAYTGGADYMTYIVLGSALNVLAVSTLMNVGRALITELREGTLEVLLLSPASRTGYFLDCLTEQTVRALLEFGTVLLIGGAFGADLRYRLSHSISAAMGTGICTNTATYTGGRVVSACGNTPAGHIGEQQPADSTASALCCVCCNRNYMV